MIRVTATRHGTASCFRMDLNERMPEPSADPLRLGQQLEREGRLDEAADAYREGVRQDPGDISTRIRLGLVLRQAGRDEEANEVFGAALALHVAVDVE